MKWGLFSKSKENKDDELNHTGIGFQITSFNTYADLFIIKLTNNSKNSFSRKKEFFRFSNQVTGDMRKMAVAI